MKNKKNNMQALLVIAFLGVTAGCGTRALLQEETTTQTAEAYP